MPESFGVAPWRLTPLSSALLHDISLFIPRGMGGMLPKRVNRIVRTIRVAQRHTGPGYQVARDVVAAIGTVALSAEAALFVQHDKHFKEWPSAAGRAGGRGTQRAADLPVSLVSRNANNYTLRLDTA